eukprot:m.206643 g.206643  ORF g.206643 m.206643 type:complete len:1226 (-) comp17107_c0_seq7:164-3841(-)
MMRMMGSRWIGAALAVLLCSCSALQCADDGSVTPLEVTSLQVLANVGEEQASQVAHLKLINVDLTQNGLASINWTKFTLSTFAISFIKSPMDTFESRHLGPLAATLIQLCFETTSLASLSNTSFTNMPRLTRLLLNDEPRLSYASDVFKPVPKLATLQLSRANINTISAAMFAPLTALTTLVLANNDLTELNSQALAHLPLKNLDLSVSAITSLNSSVLAPFPGLTELQISRMSLTRIPNTTFDSVPKLETLIWSGSVRRFIQVPVTERHLYPLTSLSRIDLDHHAISRDHIEQWGAAFADRHPLLTTFQAKFARLRVVPPFLQHLQHIARVVLSFNPITSWVKLRPKSLLDLDLLATEQLQRIPKDSLPEHGVMQLLWQVTQTPGLPYSTCAFGSDGWRCTCSNNTRPTNPLQPSDCELMCPDLVIDQQTYQGIVGTVVNTSCSLSEPPFQQATCEFDEASQRARWVGASLGETKPSFAHQCASGLVVNVLQADLQTPFVAAQPVTRVQFTHCPKSIFDSGLDKLFDSHNVVEVAIHHCQLDAAKLKEFLLLPVLSLQVLDVSFNPLRVLDPQTFNDQLIDLQVVNLSYTEMTNLPRSFAETNNLFTHLDLSNNYLTSLAELSLPRTRKLVLVDLRNNQLQSFEGDLFFNALNATQLNPNALLMDNNPSQCRLAKELDAWVLQCDCSDGSRNVPACQIDQPRCSPLNPNITLPPVSVCNGINDCINATDEASCTTMVGDLSDQLCFLPVDDCIHSCYGSITYEMTRGRMAIAPAATLCRDQGTPCLPSILSPTLTMQYAEGLMGAISVLVTQETDTDTLTIRFTIDGADSAVNSTCSKSYALRLPSPAPPSFDEPESESATSSNAGLVAGVVVSLLFMMFIAILVYRRRRDPAKTKRKAIASQLQQALETINAQTASKDVSTLRQYREHQIVEGEILGQGQYGQVTAAVYKGKLSAVARTMALKTLAPILEEGDAMSQSLIELHLLAQLEHENIVQVYGLVIDRLPLTFVMELCPHGDLRAHLLSIQTRLPPTTELSIFIQLTSALAYLHEKRILHRDLAARNVLLKSKQPCLIKLADFGLGRVLDVHAEYYRASTTRELPFRWQAPEACVQARFSMASDVWSLGIVIWEVLASGTRPYRDLPNVNAVVSWLRNGQRLELPPDNTGLGKLVQSCWQSNPALRPTAEQALERLHGLDVHDPTTPRWLPNDGLVMDDFEEQEESHL